MKNSAVSWLFSGKIKTKSASMTALHNSCPNRSESPQSSSNGSNDPGATTEGTSTTGPVNPRNPRLSKLQTLEAKMANIEVSLLEPGTGRQARPGSAGAPPARRAPRHQSLEQLSVHSTNSSPPAATASSACDGQRSLVAANQKILKLQKEVVMLQSALRQHQLKFVNDINPDTSDNPDSKDPKISSLPPELRLQQLQTTMDTKLVELRKLRTELKKVDTADLDGRIRQAELECALEKAELQVLGLRQEMMDAQAATDSANAGTQEKQTTLYWYVHRQPCQLISADVTFDPQQPSLQFGPASDPGGEGILIARPDKDGLLKPGDRVLEVNGQYVLHANMEEIAATLKQCCSAMLSKRDTKLPLKLVVLRVIPGVFNGDTRVELEKQLKLITDRLQATEKERASTKGKVCKLEKERDRLRQENTKLIHRKAYLQDQILEIRQMYERLRTSLMYLQERVNANSTTPILRLDDDTPITSLDPESADQESAKKPDHYIKHRDRSTSRKERHRRSSQSPHFTNEDPNLSEGSVVLVRPNEKSCRKHGHRISQENLDKESEKSEIWQTTKSTWRDKTKSRNKDVFIERFNITADESYVYPTNEYMESVLIPEPVLPKENSTPMPDSDSGHYSGDSFEHVYETVNHDKEAIELTKLEQPLYQNVPMRAKVNRERPVSVEHRRSVLVMDKRFSGEEWC